VVPVATGFAVAQADAEAILPLLVLGGGLRGCVAGLGGVVICVGGVVIVKRNSLG
jgi:hypothetical protein